MLYKWPSRSSIWKSGNEFWNAVNRSFGTKHHPLDLGMLKFCEYKPLSLYTHTPINECKNTIASIRTFSRTCKFQAEFVIVIVIDSKKISDFGTMHTIFEFQGRDLSFTILSFFHSTAPLKNKKIMFSVFRRRRI